jgi:oligosaccharide amylase
MTRHVILGNGNMLVCMDKDARIRDFYYPYVGQENHVSSNMHRIGVWVDGNFAWVSRNDWSLSIGYKKNALVSEIVAFNDKLKVELVINEAVHHKKNVFVRRVAVKNKGEGKREIRVFFSQHFHISETNIGGTVYYNPLLESIINYKGKRYFLMGGQHNGKMFSDYATGNAGGVNEKLGTYVDCENGALSKNSIEHGAVDSAIGFSVVLKKGGSGDIDYWIAVGKKHSEISKLREYVIDKGVVKLLKDVEKHWIEWLGRSKKDFGLLDEKIVDLFNRSLLIVRAQTDNGGAIIAANDTHTFRFKNDTYSYMWPRDGALIARSLDRVGHKDVTSRFFKFCARVISDEGYLLHKYKPDGSLGSSWHSWLKGDKLQLPIQEDETALLLDALWKHYCRHEDHDMIKQMYGNFIKKAGDFLFDFRDENGLPKESFDLWEEKLGVHTFTCSTTYAGLLAASEFAKVFGSKNDVKRYKDAAEGVKEAIMKYLYDDKKGIFLKGVYYDDKGKMLRDETIDVSTFYGLFEYHVLDIDDPKMLLTAEKTIEKLWCITPCGGLSRYVGDQYYRKKGEPENPWIISTMWLAEYYIMKAKNLDDLRYAKDLLDWVVERALPSGALSEQLDPLNGSPLSVAPLTWSHAGFVIAVLKYLDRYKELGGK